MPGFVTFSAETVIFSNKKSGAITRSAGYSVYTKTNRLNKKLITLASTIPRITPPMTSDK